MTLFWKLPRKEEALIFGRKKDSCQTLPFKQVEKLLHPTFRISGYPKRGSKGPGPGKGSLKVIVTKEESEGNGERVGNLH